MLRGPRGPRDSQASPWQDCYLMPSPSRDPQACLPAPSYTVVEVALTAKALGWAVAGQGRRARQSLDAAPKPVPHCTVTSPGSPQDRLHAPERRQP